jgi:hypothetical protein
MARATRVSHRFEAKAVPYSVLIHHAIGKREGVFVTILLVEQCGPSSLGRDAKHFAASPPRLATCNGHYRPGLVCAMRHTNAANPCTECRRKRSHVHPELPRGSATRGLCPCNIADKPGCVVQKSANGRSFISSAYQTIPVRPAQILVMQAHDCGMDATANQWHLARFMTLLSAVSVSINALFNDDECCTTETISMACSFKGVQRRGMNVL